MYDETIFTKQNFKIHTTLMRKLRTEQEIMAEWEGDISRPLVSICCITYNHEPYIEDAFEGFLIQKTDFPFEILIHDDASTDRTPDIIREYEAAYPNLFRTIYQKENQYSKGNRPGFINMERAKGKYIALCEGDDYWTDPNKLQKQTAVLHKHKKCSACFTNALFINEIDLNSKIFVNNLKEGVVPIEKIFLKGGWIYPTPSILFRNILFEHNFLFKINELAGDELLIFALSLQGDVYFRNESTCIYRRWAGGLYSKLTNDPKNLIDWKKKTIIGIKKIMNFVGKPNKNQLKKRISRESLYILKYGFFENISYLKNLNLKDSIRLVKWYTKK